MARKSRKALQIVNEEKELQVVTVQEPVLPQLATAAYIRLSVEKDCEDTVQAQIDMVHQYIASHKEFRLVDTYVDNGYTGTNFDRPEFVRLMDDVRTGRIQCIIVKDLSRFGRDFIETGYYIETIFPHLNVRLISINDDFDSSREEDRNSIVLPIKNMINEMYAKDASKKISRMYDLKMKQGNKKIAQSIYGYTVDKDMNQLKPNPETAPIVQIIFRWYQMGYGTGDIVKRLKMLHVMTPFAYKAQNNEIITKGVVPKTDRWTGDRIKTILTNQAYIGDTVCGKRKSAIYRNEEEHHVDPSEWIIHKNTHEPLVIPPEYEQVQKVWNEIGQDRKQRYERCRQRRTELIDSFPQKVRCMECGNVMSYIRYTNFDQPEGIRMAFYYCREYDHKPGYCRQRVHADFLKITVMDQIHNLIKVMCDRIKLLEEMRSETCDKGALYSAKRKIMNLQYQYTKAEETSASLYEDYAEGILDDEEYQSLKEHYISEKQRLRSEITNTEAKKRRMEKTIEHFMELEKHLEEYLDERGFNQKLVDELVDYISVSSKGIIEVRFKCADVFRETLKITEGSESTWL